MKLNHRIASILFGIASLALVCPQLEAQQTGNATPAAAEVTVDASQIGAPISPYIYGQFIEHLGRCIYGGIWAEMLEDRKFYYPVPAPGEIWRTTREQARVLAASPWKLLDSTTVNMTEKGAFVGKHSPEIEASDNGSPSGIYQEGLGLLKGEDYVGYIILAGDGGIGPVTISLTSDSGETQVQAIRKVSAKFTKVTFKFTAAADSDNGRLTIATKGKGLLRIGCASLMPADNIEGFRKDTMTLLRQLNAPVYRWPGGNFVSGYDWRDGLGDRDQRPPRANPAWTGIEPNDVGMHEFIRFCELLNTEPMIAVNTGFGDAYSAAAEVEYANGSTDTPMGKLRARNGHAKPFKVKWWCVGNEMWGRWQLGYMQPGHYVLKHNWVEEKMREADPAIKTIASGDLGDNWSRAMLTNCADHMDLISEHFYCQTRTNFTIAEHVQQIPGNIKRIAEAHRQFRREIPGLEGKDIRIALDEWNYWYGPNVFGELGTRYFLKDGLGIAAGLHEYFRNSDIIFMANYAQTVNVIGCIKTTKTHAEFDSTAFPLMLYRQQFGTLPVKVSHQAAPLDISAAFTSDQKAFTLAVVNPTANTVQLKFNLSGVHLSDRAKTWEITGEDAMSYNQPGEPRKVSVHEVAPADLAAAVSVKPLSVTLWRAPVQ